MKLGSKYLSSFKANMVNLAIISLSFGYLSHILSGLDVGVDFSDEGKHLNDARYPYLYPNQIVNYGYLLNPIFSAVGHNIFYYRIINIVSIGLLGIASFYLIYFISEFRKLYSNLHLFSMGLMTSLIFLTFFNMWLPTPNYYSLTFQLLVILWITFTIYFLDFTMCKGLILVVASTFLSLLLFVKPTTFLLMYLILNYFLSRFESNWYRKFFLLTSLVSVEIVALSTILDRKSVV